MLTSKKEYTEQKFTTHITQGSRSEGKLQTSDNVRIDGEFIGDIEVTGKLVTGEGSFIRGNVSAIDAIIGGKVEGSIKTVWSVTIQETGCLLGDIVTEELIVERGASFDGNCDMSTEVKISEKDTQELLLQEA